MHEGKKLHFFSTLAIIYFHLLSSIGSMGSMDSMGSIGSKGSMGSIISIGSKEHRKVDLLVSEFASLTETTISFSCSHKLCFPEYIDNILARFDLIDLVKFLKDFETLTSGDNLVWHSYHISN